MSRYRVQSISLGKTEMGEKKTWGVKFWFYEIMKL